LLFFFLAFPPDSGSICARSGCSPTIRWLKTSRWRWHLLRTLLATGAMFGFFFGLSRMPLVNALTIAFTAPLFVTGLSVPFLGEHVGWRRWLAVIAGFIGVVIVLRPGQGMFTPAAIGVIIAAICYAGLALTARKLAATESSFALSVYVVAGPLLVSTTLISENYTAPTAGGWFFFALAGMCSGAVRVHGDHRRRNRRLPDLGRGSRHLGNHGRSRDHRQRVVHRLPRNRQRHVNPLFARSHRECGSRDCPEISQTILALEFGHRNAGRRSSDIHN
jgi:hypothetical protein